MPLFYLQPVSDALQSSDSDNSADDHVYDHDHINPPPPQQEEQEEEPEEQPQQQPQPLIVMNPALNGDNNPYLAAIIQEWDNSVQQAIGQWDDIPGYEADTEAMDNDDDDDSDDDDNSTHPQDRNFFSVTPNCSFDSGDEWIVFQE